MHIVSKAIDNSGVVIAVDFISAFNALDCTSPIAAMEIPAGEFIERSRRAAFDTMISDLQGWERWSLSCPNCIRSKR